MINSICCFYPQQGEKVMEKWEEYLNNFLAANGIISGDMIEIPSWWKKIKTIPIGPKWCDQDSWVGNHLISQLYQRMKLNTERSETITLGKRMNAYLKARTNVFVTYVQIIFSGTEIELELNLDQQTVRYIKPIE